MKQLIFNSFPRSGSVYQRSNSQYFLDNKNLTTSVVHIPEIFNVEDVCNIIIFRKPEDAISSLIMKQMEPKEIINSRELYNMAEHMSKNYQKFMIYAEESKDNIYIGQFDNLINNTVEHFEKISKRFNLTLKDDYAENFLNRELPSNALEDKYGGHLPRPKDIVRLNIEENLSKMGFIQEVNELYEEFIYDIILK